MDELRWLLAAIESQVGQPVDVAASCGLGRRGTAAAEAVMPQSVQLCSTSAG
jgi:hypothetical protein